MQNVTWLFHRSHSFYGFYGNLVCPFPLIGWIVWLNYISHCATMHLHAKILDTKAKEPLNTTNQADTVQEADLWTKRFVFAYIIGGEKRCSTELSLVKEKFNTLFAKEIFSVKKLYIFFCIYIMRICIHILYVYLYNTFLKSLTAVCCCSCISSGQSYRRH